MKKTEAIQLHRNLAKWATHLDVELDEGISLPEYTSEVSTRANELQAKKEDHLRAVQVISEELADNVDPEGAETEDESTKQVPELVQ